jgi:hypothetical protein
MGGDPKEQALKFAARIDFQAICYKLSCTMVETRPEGAPRHAHQHKKPLAQPPHSGLPPKKHFVCDFSTSSSCSRSKGKGKSHSTNTLLAASPSRAQTPSHRTYHTASPPPRNKPLTHTPPPRFLPLPLTILPIPHSDPLVFALEFLNKMKEEQDAEKHPSAIGGGK